MSESVSESRYVTWWMVCVAIIGIFSSLVLRQVTTASIIFLIAMLVGTGLLFAAPRRLSKTDDIGLIDHVVRLRWAAIVVALIGMTVLQFRTPRVLTVG